MLRVWNQAKQAAYSGPLVSLSEEQAFSNSRL
jgi:hypothetical protein